MVKKFNTIKKEGCGSGLNQVQKPLNNQMKNNKEETAQDIINQSELSQEDETDLNISKLCQGRVKRR